MSDHAGNGADVDDVSTPLAPQVRQCSLRHAQRTEKIDLHLPARFGIAQLLDSTHEPVARVVHDEVDTAAALDGSDDCRTHLLAVSKIQDAPKRAPGKPGLEAVRLILLAKCGDHRIAPLKGRLCECAADAAAKRR